MPDSATLPGSRLPSIMQLARLSRDPHGYLAECRRRYGDVVYTFFPFGAGVWRCLGAQFAEYEMRVVLARIVETLDLEPASEAPIRPLMRGFTIAPSEGLPVRVRRRRAAEVAA